MALEGNFKTAVSDLITNMTEAEKVNINEAIFQASFGVGSFPSAHTVRYGVRNGNKIPIVLANNKYGYLNAGDETDCELNTCDMPINYALKEWNLGEYNCRLPICMRSFDEAFLQFWNMYRQRLEDPTQEPDAQAYLDYLTGIIEENIKGAMWRTGYLGDKASLNTLINNNDGFIVQALAGNGTKIQVTQPTPTGEQIYGYLEQAYNAVNSELWAGESDLVWKMTYKMASTLVTFLNKQADLSPYNCDCINPDAIVGARRFRVEGLRVFGIPVEVHREIDGSLLATSSTYNYQALLIRKSNMLVGTNTSDKMEMFDMFFDKKDRKIYIDAMIYLGVSIPLDSEYVLITNEPLGS